MTRTLCLLFFLVLTAVGVSAQQDSKYRAPRTESRQPDLQGVWNFNTAVPMQRPASVVAGKRVFTKEEFEARRVALRNVLGLIGKFAPVEDVGLDWMDGTIHVDDLRTSLITYPENGRLPAVVEKVRRMPQPEDFIAALAEMKDGKLPPALGALLAAFQGGKKDSYTDFMMTERCLIDAFVPMVPQFDDNVVKIIQGPDHVVLVTDYWRRVVPLDGRPQVAGALRSWAGTSRGRWDGETLVIETRNFNDRLPSFAGVGDGREKVVTERLTRTAANRIDYSASVVDPKSFKDRVELSFPMALVNQQVLEFGCHEGNYSMRNSLSAARLADRQAVK
jgi:hypothetical protein